VVAIKGGDGHLLMKLEELGDEAVEEEIILKKRQVLSLSLRQLGVLGLHNGKAGFPNQEGKVNV